MKQKYGKRTVTFQNPRGMFELHPLKAEDFKMACHPLGSYRQQAPAKRRQEEMSPSS